MPKHNSHTRTLLKAAEAVGGPHELADRLGVSLSVLREWIRGDSAPPFAVFSQALDIVARGPYGRTKR
jgi:hypothetical protein